MANSNLTEDMINKLQSLKCETTLKFYQNISNYYDEKNYFRQNNTFMFEEDPFSRYAEDVCKIFPEVSLLI